MRTIPIVGLFAALVACGGDPATETTAADPAPATAAAPAPAEPAAQEWTLPADANPALKDPSLAQERAPDTYKVRFETTKGPFVVQVTRDWSPNGADRLYNLAKIGYYDDAAFFRAIDGFMVQFGISGYPEASKAWREATIEDDPVKKSNTRGMVTFAKTNMPNSRSTQLFVNYKDNSQLDRMGFSPLGEVVEGMEVVDSLYKGYGEGAPRGRGPNQGQVQSEGNRYLKKEYPQLDYIERATIVD